jgi:vancomycin resistance protein VanW
MKKLIPPDVKVRLRSFQRYLVDLSTGQLSKFTKFTQLSEEQKLLFKPEISISQVLRKTQYSGNKIHNLALAIERIQDVVIKPGEVFSFWHLVGKPDKANGYLEGRSLVNNQLKVEFGGGLCQLSGMMYFLTLKTGLTTLERHAHSHDIYTEATRFAPLGSDATVVYGYKDLRFRNNLAAPVCFRFLIKEDEIIATICSTQAITELNIEFKLEDFPGETKVDTVRFAPNGNTFEVLNSTTYEKLV